MRKVLNLWKAKERPEPVENPMPASGPVEGWYDNLYSVESIKESVLEDVIQIREARLEDAFAKLRGELPDYVEVSMDTPIDRSQAKASKGISFFGRRRK